MSISKETIDYVAHLARIELQPKELDKLARQLETIVDFIDRLKELDINNISETTHILPINNVVKSDQPADSLPAEEALVCAPEKKAGFFVVPKIIE